jgi:hypothetical protein
MRQPVYTRFVQAGSKSTSGIGSLYTAPSTGFTVVLRNITWCFQTFSGRGHVAFGLQATTGTQGWFIDWNFPYQQTTIRLGETNSTSSQGWQSPYPPQWTGRLAMPPGWQLIVQRFSSTPSWVVTAYVFKWATATTAAMPS